MRSLALLCAYSAASTALELRASPHVVAPGTTTPGSAAAAAAAALDHANRVGPHRIAPDLDCAVRSLAAQFSAHLLPWADPALAADALRLAIDCNASSPAAAATSSTTISAAPNAIAPAADAFYADAVNGDDGNAGTQAAPFRTIARGLQATRAITPAAPAQLVLRAGTFWLASSGGTLELTPADSQLTISAFPGEAPVVSGGVPLAGLSWVKVPAPPPAPPKNMTDPTQGSLLCAPPLGCCVDGPGKSNPGVCAALGQLPSAAACAAACAANSTCTGYTWHDASTGGFAQWCYARLDGIDDCDGAAGHVSAWKPGAGPAPANNVWQATVPAGVADFDQLFFNGRRITRARYPNANPEVDLSPAGYMSPTGWAGANAYPAPNETHINGVRPYDPWFPDFQWGTQGTVANFTTGSFWGTRNPPAGSQYSVPSGVTMPAGVPSAGAWKNPQEAIVHAFQGGHWGNWQFGIESISGNSLTFSKGGWQEARGGGGQGIFVEGPIELLDVVGEWHWDPAARALTVAFNGTAHDGSETLVAAQLAELVRVTGSRAAPVTGVTLSGLTFAHTLTDYFLNYTVPSGGDWSFHDGGMVRLAGTEGASVLSNVFLAPGGNGLQISEHNRATVVRGNHFAWTGASAIVSAGLGGGTPTGGPDFPEGTVIEGNLMREIGVIIKQSGGLYMGVSANLTFRNNVGFNMARAAVNINDGFAGGHLLASNLIFNSVRETNDHGGINSWDRQPYSWRSWDPSNVNPLPMLETRNFIINNYK